MVMKITISCNAFWFDLISDILNIKILTTECLIPIQYVYVRTYLQYGDKRSIGNEKTLLLTCAYEILKFW